MKKYIQVNLRPEEIREFKLALPRIMESHIRQELICRSLDMYEWADVFKERKEICNRLFNLFVRL